MVFVFRGYCCLKSQISQKTKYYCTFKVQIITKSAFFHFARQILCLFNVVCKIHILKRFQNVEQLVLISRYPKLSKRAWKKFSCKLSIFFPLAPWLVFLHSSSTIKIFTLNLWFKLSPTPFFRLKIVFWYAL